MMMDWRRVNIPWIDVAFCKVHTEMTNVAAKEVELNLKIGSEKTPVMIW